MKVLQWTPVNDIKKNNVMDINKRPTIAEKNEVIGLYMGGKWKKVEWTNWEQKRFYIPTKEDPNYWCKNTTSLNYHKDWEELMPVVLKISKMPLENTDGTPCTDPQDTCYPITFNMPTEDGKQVMFRFKGFACHTAPTLMEAVYEACFEIAQWEVDKTKTEDHE